MFTYEGDAGVYRHIQRRGSGSGVQLNKRVRILRGECQPQRRPNHRGDLTQEADDLVRGICGTHGEYETAEVRDVRRIGGGRGLRGGGDKE